MKCINFFKTGEEANNCQKFLREKGIVARVMVDPLEGRFPALSHFGNVGLYVEDESVETAQGLVNRDYRAA